MTNVREYSVGPLLYMPGLRTDIADKLLNGGFVGRASIAVCLEDTIKDNMVEEAELNTAAQIKRTAEAVFGDDRRLPDIYIRVRAPGQIGRITDMLGDGAEIIKGFILPKIDDEEIKAYIDVIKETKNKNGQAFLYMPIIENPLLLRLDTRYGKLRRLWESFMSVKEYILNVRVGGNDFCRTMGISCGIDQTIYDISPVANMLSDIAVTFTPDFTVSAPVWNYFDNGSDDRWKTGLEREMKLDKMYGFIGKSVIHPSQIDAVRANMAVSRSELSDAKLLIDSAESEIQVIKGTAGDRMLEHKIHMKWAEKIIALSEIYGVKE